MTSKKKDLNIDQPLNVPFVGKDQLEYSHGQERSVAAESLIEREFGDLGQLQISNNHVTLGDQTLIDLDQPESQTNEFITSASGSKPNRFQISPSASPHTDRSIQPIKLDTVFRLRQINDGEGLRIAVQSPLLVAQTGVLREFLSELKRYSANSFEIDLNLCNDMSITGLGILLLIHKNLDVQSEQIKVINGKPAILQLLRWAGMEKYFSLQAI